MQYNVYFTLHGIRYRRPFRDLESAQKFYNDIVNNPSYIFVSLEP